MYQADALPRRALLGLQVGAEARVERVVDGGAARAAGVLQGDRILTVDGAAVHDARQLTAAARGVRAGASVAFRVERDGAARALSGIAPPYPVEEGVLLGHVTSRGARLRTFYAIPRDGEKLPAVLYLQGVRTESVESPFDPASPTRALVSALVAAGFVVMRVERSGVGDSEGPTPRETGLAAEMDAYRAALADLRAFDEVDPDRILLFGHSFGGMVAPLLARETAVAGIAVFGTSARRWHDAMLGTTRRQRERGEEEMARWEELFDRVHRDGLTPARAFELHPHLRVLRSRDCEGETMYGRHVSLFQELDGADLQDAWRGVKTPVVAMHGEHDWICTAEDAGAVAALSGGRHVELDGTSHDLTRDGAFDPRIAQTTTALQPPGNTQP